MASGGSNNCELSVAADCITDRHLSALSSVVQKGRPRVMRPPNMKACNTIMGGACFLAPPKQVSCIVSRSRGAT
ncbi:hypothetical protein U91I_00558 [alpha proteobacterium U9-1i]|nr:hypothetical protein U91I_00558 [alpha proteobacterium U9-1i]